MSKIIISDKQFNLYADHRAKEAMKRYSCNPKDLLTPLVDMQFKEPNSCKNVTIEVKINNNIKGNFIVQPTLVETEKWFIMTFTNLVDKPRHISDNKYEVKLMCGHTMINDASVTDVNHTVYYECQICKNIKR
jgi:hypothetical protein